MISVYQTHQTHLLMKPKQRVILNETIVRTSWLHLLIALHMIVNPACSRSFFFLSCTFHQCMLFCLQPPNIKSFINSITTVPLENVELPLKNFAWEFDKVCKSDFLCIASFVVMLLILISCYQIGVGGFPSLGGPFQSL